MLNAVIHGFISVNCMAEVDTSNCVHSGNATNRPASEPISAIRRAMGALRSAPVASVSSPAMMGTQMVRLRMGSPESIVSVVRPGRRRTRSDAGVPERQQNEDADDHGKGVVI